MSVDGTLMGTRILDRDSLTVGRPVPLVPLVRRSAYSDVGQYDLRADGTLTYMPGLNANVGRLVMVGRDGRAEPLPIEAEGYLRFAPSPDGSRIAAVVEGTQRQELRVYDLARGTKETHDAGFYLGAPVWSPDGRSLAYVTADAPGRERVLLRAARLAGGATRTRRAAELDKQPGLGLRAPGVSCSSASRSRVGPLVIDPSRTACGGRYGAAQDVLRVDLA